jgi:hypothetical protein
MMRLNKKEELRWGYWKLSLEVELGKARGNEEIVKMAALC